MIGPWTHAAPDDEARREIPLTEVDRLYGEYRIRHLTAGWPFSKENGHYEPPPPKDEVERIAQQFFGGREPWPDAMRDLLDHYRHEGDGAEAARVAALLADAFPYREEDQRTAADLLRRLGRPEAEIYERRADPRQAAARPEDHRAP